MLVKTIDQTIRSGEELILARDKSFPQRCSRETLGALFPYAFPEDRSVLGMNGRFRGYRLPYQLPAEELKKVVHLVKGRTESYTYEEVVGKEDVLLGNGKIVSEQIVYERTGKRSVFVVMFHRIPEVERILNVPPEKTVLRQELEEHANFLAQKVAEHRMQEFFVPKKLDEYQAELSNRWDDWQLIFEAEQNAKSGMTA